MRAGLRLVAAVLIAAALGAGLAAPCGSAPADRDGPWIGIGGIFQTDPYLINASFWLHRPRQNETNAAVPISLLCKVGWFEAKIRCGVDADGRMTGCAIGRFWAMDRAGSSDMAALRKGALSLARAAQLDRHSPAFRTAADGTVELTIADKMTCDPIELVPVRPANR